MSLLRKMAQGRLDRLNPLIKKERGISPVFSMANTIIPGDIAKKSINMRYADPILRL